MNKKRIIGIAGGAVLVLALGGVTAVLLNSPDTETEDTTEEETTASTVVTDLTTEDTDSVKSIDISGPQGDFEVVRVSKGDGDEKSVFTITGYEDLPIDTSVLWTLANNTATLSTVDTVVTDCTDMEKYGLDDATAVCATLHFDDGTDYSFRVGNMTYDGDTNYFSVEGDDTVYLVTDSLVSNFKLGVDSFLSTTLLEAPADEDDYPIVNYLKIQRDDLDYDFDLEYDESSDDDDVTGGSVASHVMVSPVEAYLNGDESTDVVTGMFGLTANSIAYTHPTDAQTKECGLDDPFGVVTMDCDDGNTYVLNIGNRYLETDEDGTETPYYYIAIEGTNAIFSIEEEDLIWATVQPTDITSKMVFGAYVWDITTLDITVGDEELNFEVSATSADDAVVKKNGKTTSSERYREFYSFLLNTKAETITLDGTPSGDPLATVTLKTNNGYNEKNIAFYEMDAFTALITVDGKSAYTCRKSYLDTLLYNMENYETDEDFRTTWS